MLTRVTKKIRMSERCGRSNTITRHPHAAVDAVHVEQLAGGGAGLISGVTLAVERMRTWEEIGTANKKSYANEANAGEAGVGMGRGAETVSRRGSTSLRPYVVPYTDRSTPPAVRPVAAVKKLGPDDNGVTLRCMYTNQKTKKRKVWSDGAVKCCRKRLRVCLYRWSEVLGITDKLLGEIYLSAPEYEAFVTAREPELEMELYIASLDGVVQNNPPGGSGQADAGGAEQSAGAIGRKRKLLKPFKPPSRRAPSCPPSAAASAPMFDPRGPSGRINEGQNGGQFGFGREGARGDGRGALPARTSYTGFGHVEGLSDDDPECEDASVGLARDNAAWGIGAGGGRSAHRGRDGSANAFADPRSEEAQAMQLPAETFVANGSSSGSGVLRGQGGGCGEERDSSRFSHDSGLDETFGHYAEGERGGDGGRAHAFPDDRRQAAPFVESFRSEEEAERMSFPTTSSFSWGEREVVDARGSRRFATEYGDGSSEDGRREGRHFGRGTLPDNRVGAQRTHEPIPEPKGDEGQVRSTQDILSLFGGFGESPFGDQNAGTPPREREEMPAAPLRSRGSNEVSPAHARGKRDTEKTLVDLELASIPGSFVLPATGKGRAADMRRAQSAARAVEPPTSTGLEDGAAAGVAAARAVDAAPSDWACDVCGVRGSPSWTSCRVCGAKRRSRRNDARGSEGGGGDCGGGGGGDGGDDTLDDEKGDSDLGSGERGGGNDPKGTGWGCDAGDEGTEEIGVSSWVGSDDMANGREVDDTFGSNVEGATCQGVGVGELRGNPPGCHSFSPAGGERLGVASGTAGASGTPRKRQSVGVRMQMDLGSSSDGDND